MVSWGKLKLSLTVLEAAAAPAVLQAAVILVLIAGAAAGWTGVTAVSAEQPVAK